MRICLNCSQPLSDKGWKCEACNFQPPSRNGVLMFSEALAELGAGFDAQLFSQMAPLEAGHFWYRARNRLILWAFEKHFGQAQSLLEIGCGTGFVLSGFQKAYPKLRLAGSEIFTEGLTFASGRLPGAELSQMDARHLPFREEFDVIGAFDVLEHIQEDEDVLREMRNAVSPGGGILLTVPQHPRLWGVHDERNHHVRRYTRAELASKVERAGFKIRHVTSFVSFLLPAMWASRLVDKKAKLDESHEFDINPVLNRVFEAVMNVEMNLIRLGVDFPAGGSLLMVAQAPDVYRSTPEA